MQPKISVIIPVYNVYQYISDCLDSIFCQDIDNSCYEVIVVDDCSPYGEKAIVDTYIKKYTNIKYIRHNVNKRQGGARNTGLRIACGEYIMFIDADDFLIHRNVFSILLHYANKHNSVVLRSESYQIFSQSTHYKNLEKIFINVDKIKYTVSNFKKWRSGNISCSACSTLYKRIFLLENNLFFRENVLFEDTDWVQKTMYYATNIDFINIPFYGYRQSVNSTTRGYSIAAFEGNIDGIIETFRFFKEIEFDNTMREFLNEGFTKNVIGVLKTSSNYPIQKSHDILNKLNICGVTSIKSKSSKSRCILYMMRYVPLFPIAIVKFSVSIKRIFKMRAIKNLLCKIS